MTPEEAVTLKAYLDSLITAIDRRLDTLERHLEKVEDRTPQFLTRELYDERHEELRRDVARLEARKATAETAVRLVARVQAVENWQRESQLLVDRRSSDRRRRLGWAIAIAATIGAFSSAGVTLLLHAF